MTPEETQRIEKLEKQLNYITDLFFSQHFVDKDVFQNPVYLNGKLYFKDGLVSSVGATTGLTLGATGDKIGFLGKTPLARQGSIAAPSAPGGTYAQAEAQSAVTAINSLIAALKNFGLTS